jgi:hypothetical protein
VLRARVPSSGGFIGSPESAGSSALETCPGI